MNLFRTMLNTDTQALFRSHNLTTTGITAPPGRVGNFYLSSRQLGPQFNAVLLRDRADTPGRDMPVLGYWVPQGGYADIPLAGGDINYVFTPDFTGCSLFVDQFDSHYRVYHVQGGKPNAAGVAPCDLEYFSKPEHGLGLAAQLGYSDYGSAEPTCFAMMKYEKGRWWIYYQRKQGPMLGYSLSGKFTVKGPQHLLGGGAIPVADLRREIPKSPNSTEGRFATANRDLSVQRAMAPNTILWGSAAD